MVVVFWHEIMIHVEEDDDFYELQPADYYKLFSNRMAGNFYVFLLLFENIHIYHCNAHLPLFKSYML
jgi:hypothetical protein